MTENFTKFINAYFTILNGSRKFQSATVSPREILLREKRGKTDRSEFPAAKLSLGEPHGKTFV